MDTQLRAAYSALIESLKYTRTDDLKSAALEAQGLLANMDHAVAVSDGDIDTFTCGEKELFIDGLEVSVARVTLVLIPEFINDREVKGDFDPYEFLGISREEEISVDNAGPEPL